MNIKPVIEIRAAVRVERGTAAHCACGGLLERDDDGWRCADCGREYA